MGGGGGGGPTVFSFTWVERYVSVSGGGLNDGTSEANAWTWDQAMANYAAGQRINVKAGTYTNSGASTVSSTIGSRTNPIHFRGYKNTIGDLDDSLLVQLVDGVDIPVISTTTQDSGPLSRYLNVSYISFKTSATYSSQSHNMWELGPQSAAYHCRFISTGGQPAISGGFHFDCYFESTRNCVHVGEGFDGCVFKKTGTGSNSTAISELRGPCINSLFVGFKFGLGPSTLNARPVISSCTFVDISDSAIFPNFVGDSQHQGAILISNNYFYNVVNPLWTNNGGYCYMQMISNGFYNVTTMPQAGTIFQRWHRTDTTDPFVDYASGDYTLVSGSLGYSSSQPQTLNQYAIASGRDLGAIQHIGSSTVFHPLASLNHPLAQ